MKRIIHAAILLAATTTFCLANTDSQAHAQVPQYQVLRSPSPAMHHGGHGYYPAHAQPVSRQRYAYGWFGAQPRRHWSRHFGYYREYTQWTAR